MPKAIPVQVGAALGDGDAFAYAQQMKDLLVANGDAADHMVLEEVGRLPVVSRDNPRTVVGMISRSDLLRAHAPRLAADRQLKRARKWRR